MSTAVLTILQDAVYELNAYRAGKTLTANDGVFCLGKLNDIFDLWNAKADAVWCDIFSAFTLTASLSPHTIGPSGATWTMAVRPVTLYSCSLNLNTQTPNVYEPIDIIDRQTYEALSVPGISTAIPTAVYYEPDFPLGKLFFYPVPNTAYAVRLATRTLLAQVASTDSIDLPPGYKQALTLTLAEDIASGFGRQVMPKTEQRAREARAAIFANNIQSPGVDFRDGQQADHRSNFNYLSRSFTG